LKETGRSMKDVPLVIQFNKRDLTNVRTDAEIDELARKGREPVYKASAVNGQGVLECFFGLLDRSWRKLDAEHDLTQKLGLEPNAFLDRAAASLGYEGKARSLCGAFVGAP
jgi:mutual gliding-motility protein MglA